MRTAPLLEDRVVSLGFRALGLELVRGDPNTNTVWGPPQKNTPQFGNPKRDSPRRPSCPTLPFPSKCLSLPSFFLLRTKIVRPRHCVGLVMEMKGQGNHQDQPNRLHLQCLQRGYKQRGITVIMTIVLKKF